VHEFLRAVARTGALALDGGAAPHSGLAGYRPGSHILRQYFDITDVDDVNIVQEKVAGRIVALDGDSTTVSVPILALLRALPGTHRFFDLQVNERRQRVFAALMWLGRRIASDRALVLAYEDLQWVTSDTRDFLNAFALELPPSTLVVLTFRSDYDAGWLMNRGHLEIRLDGLAPAATRQIVTDLLGDDESLATLKEELPRQSGGNPLFIEECVRSMLESGELVGQPGRYRIGIRSNAITIPPTVRAVLESRIDRLGRDDKHVLQAVATVGEVATVSLLERVVDLPADELRKALRRLEMAGLLVDRPDAEQRAYEFRHSLTQAVAYDTLLHQRRRELHLAIMAALRDSGNFDALARHAVQGEAWNEALTYLRAAGQLAAQLGGVEAISYFERALAVLQHLPSSEGLLEVAFDLHCDLRNALVPLGPQRRLLDVLKAAEQLAEKLGDERRLAQVYSYLSNYYGYVGRSDLALEAGERSLILGERAGAVNLLIAGNMSAGEIYRTLGDYTKAQKYLNDALALIDSGDAQKYLGQVGLPSVRARSHLAWTLAELGDFPAARDVATEAMRLADASNHPYSLCHACLGLGGTRVRQGEFDAAIGVLARGFAASEQVPLLRPSIATDLGLAHARCGRVAEGLDHVNAAVERATTMGRYSRLPLLLVKCGEVHVLAGKFDEAAVLATTALRLATEQKERGNEVYALLLLAEISALGQPVSEEAEQRYLAALGLATALGMRPLAAHAHAGLWRHYRRRSEHAKLREHLAAATTSYRDMGMRFWLDRLEGETTDRSSVALASA
jgi:tetratricopeptide (TPR) repeat protein